MWKSWIKRGLIASRAMQLAGRMGPQKAAILMYHSVMEDPLRRVHDLGRIVHSTAVFKAQMEILASEYNPANMDDVLLFIQGKKTMPSRAVVVTFDDGYADNFEIVMPILNAAGVPATFYVVVGSLENGMVPWPGRLRYCFFQTRRTHWEAPDGARFSLAHEGEKEAAFLHACDHCAKLVGRVQEEFLRSTEAQLEARPPLSNERMMMTWDQVRALSKSGHIIGSHTMSHPNMAYVTRDAAEHELAESKQHLERVLNAPIAHFSYPCPALTPHWTLGTVGLSQKLGYHTAVTTDGGPVRQKDDPLCLHRIRPTKEVEGLRWNLECSFLGRAM